MAFPSHTKEVVRSESEEVNTPHDAHNLARGGLMATDAHGESLMALDPKAEARLRLKIDVAIVPLAALMFLFCFIDRANIGNARLAGLEKDLGMRGNDYNAVNSIFYVAYIVFEFPSNLVCKIIGPGWYLPTITIAFGLTSIGSAYANNFSQLAGVRFLLGIFESGLMPGLTYFMSRWYRRSELTFRLSAYIVTAPLAGAFGGLLASAILELDGFGDRIPAGSWRAIFALEGIITVAIGLASLALLTDRPETAWWLSDAEKDLAVARLKSERIATTTVLDKINKKKLWRGVANPVTFATAMVFLLCSVTVNGLGFFLPTIIRTIFPGASTVRQQLLTVPPYAVGSVSVLVVGYLSWKIDNRQVLMIVCAPLVMTGYIMFLATQDPTTRYAATFLIASAVFIYGPLTHSQASANVVSDSARTMSVAVTMFFGNIGSLISTWSFMSWDGPVYRIGNGLNLATSSTILVLSTLTLFWMKWDNKRRNARDVDAELTGLAPADVEELEWKHPAFRWKP